MKQNKQPHRSEAYIELRDRLFNIFMYSYIIARLDMPEEKKASKKGMKKYIHKSNIATRERIASLINKWDELTLSECGEVFSLRGLISNANRKGYKMINKSENMYALRSRCEVELLTIMPKPKRKRMTAVKVGR